MFGAYSTVCVKYKEPRDVRMFVDLLLHEVQTRRVMVWQHSRWTIAASRDVTGKTAF